MKGKAKEDDFHVLHGDVISFASTTAVKPDEYGGGFPVSLLGLNDTLQVSVLERLVWYPNSCDPIPFGGSDSTGWMIFVSKSAYIIENEPSL